MKGLLAILLVGTLFALGLGIGGTTQPTGERGAVLFVAARLLGIAA